MKIDPSVSALQLHKDQDLVTTFIVRGPGHSSKVPGHTATPGTIRSVTFGRHTGSSMLTIEWLERGGRRVGIRALHLSADEMRKGSRFLRDLYAEEDRLDLWEAFCKWQVAAAQGRKVRPLPDAAMPKQMLAWRDAEAAGESVYEFEMPAVAEKPLVRKSKDAA